MKKLALVFIFLSSIVYAQPATIELHDCCINPAFGCSDGFNDLHGLCMKRNFTQEASCDQYGIDGKCVNYTDTLTPEFIHSHNPSEPVDSK